MQIIITWADMTGMRDTGKLHRPDGINWQKVYESAPEAKAAMWLNDGTQNDIEKAEQHAKTLEPNSVLVRVYCFNKGERNPLAKARAKILKEINR